MLDQELYLTFIPARYWNAEISEFELLSSQKELPKKSSFFLLWNQRIQAKNDLEDLIKNKFDQIPVSKLLECNIKLAVPNEFDIDKLKKVPIKKQYGKILPILPAIKLLNQLNVFKNYDKSEENSNYSDSVKAWALITKLTYELLNRGDFVPLLEKDSEDRYIANWCIFLKYNSDRDRFREIVNSAPWNAYLLPFNILTTESSEEEGNISYSDEVWHPTYIFSDFMKSIGDLLIRFILKTVNFQTFEEFYNLEIRKDKQREKNLSWDYKFLKALITKDNTFKITQFHETILPKVIKNWIDITNLSPLTYGVRLTLKLDYPKNNEDEWPLNIYLTNQRDGNIIPLSNKFTSDNPLEFKFLTEFNRTENFIESLLRSLGKVRKIYPPVESALNDQSLKEIYLSSGQVMEFLNYPKDLLIQSGFDVILPEVFHIGGKQRLNPRLIISSSKKSSEDLKAIQNPMFQAESLLNYKWELELGEEEVKEQNIEKILETNSPLMKLENTWIMVDQNDLRNIKDIINSSGALTTFNQASGRINYIEAVKLGLSEKIELNDGSSYQVIIEGGLKDIINQIKSFEDFKKIETPISFKGKLRPYQQQGLTWMGNMCNLNFGLCLADDMGLGKTIQVIALFLHYKEKNSNSMYSNLVVCPTSLLYNWQREIKKFGADLEVIIHHGSERLSKLSEISKYKKPHTIILTSYGTIRNDIDLFKNIFFSGIIIDESQNIKNYKAQQTQAVYKLRSDYRICLSGTPIENRLLELWSLFQFLNPGLLGARREFQENFIIPIERFHNKDAIEKLKKIIAPFILRRVKTDKNIIKDLPEKNEIKIYVELSELQFTLYKDLVEDALKKMDSKLEENKSIIILSLLTKLKQICNHPYQYLHEKVTIKNLEEDFEDLISQSPKFERLLEMLDEVIDKKEKAIIFTQFTQMGDILEKILNYKYNFSILYFHGGLPADKREGIVNKFQSENISSPPILIISLKAGGIGLNLTAANTVFHFDRWWNPAVEKQATDRAYRIGQTETVNVYKFITVDTIEEKIDNLIQDKEELAETIISDGESWISNLNEEKIKELILLEK